MKSIVFIIFIAAVLGLGIFLSKDSFMPKKEAAPQLTEFRVVLDWTPNTNHTGMYVAQAKGWYKEEGLDVKILPYSSASAPEVMVNSGKAEVGVSSAEGVIANAASGTPVVSIGAIVAHNTSGFLARADSGIETPKDLDGKLDGSWGSPIEAAILKEIITKDGGKGTFKTVNLDVAAMQALSTKKIDFFWVFEGWEVIQARKQGLDVVYFPSLQYGIPDYYTPVLVTSPQAIKEKPELLKKFMRATAKGYMFAIEHPKEASDILIASTPAGTFPDKDFVRASQSFLSGHYVDKGGTWGMQEQKAWEEYPTFLLKKGAVVDAAGKPVKTLDFDSLYTNDFLQ
jgi:ABC-type nitrate/sulfonate/bicarbonate transport system substrate-binding protein